MSDIRPDEYVRTVESVHPLRLERCALLGVYAPQDDGGAHIAGARLDWRTGKPIEVWAATKEGNEAIAQTIREWQEHNGFATEERAEGAGRERRFATFRKNREQDEAEMR